MKVKVKKSDAVLFMMGVSGLFLSPVRGDPREGKRENN